MTARCSISKVAGESLLGEPYEIVIAKIKAAHRPVVIHFLGAYMNPDPIKAEPLRAAVGAPASAPGFPGASLVLFIEIPVFVSPCSAAPPFSFVAVSD